MPNAAANTIRTQCFSVVFCSTRALWEGGRHLVVHDRSPGSKIVAITARNGRFFNQNASTARKYSQSCSASTGSPFQEYFSACGAFGQKTIARCLIVFFAFATPEGGKSDAQRKAFGDAGEDKTKERFPWLSFSSSSPVAAQNAVNTDLLIRCCPLQALSKSCCCLSPRSRCCPPSLVEFLLLHITAFQSQNSNKKNGQKRTIFADVPA